MMMIKLDIVSNWRFQAAITFTKFLIYSVLVFFVLSLAEISSVTPVFSAILHQNQKKSTSGKKSKSKSRTKSKKIRRRGLPKAHLKDSEHDSTLAQGVIYKHLIAGKGKYSLHILEIDIRGENSKICLLKGQNRCTGLEKLAEIVCRTDSLTSDSVLGAVNANFWKAYQKTPIGPTVVDGEVVELPSYKHWSSGFFDENNHLFIGQFTLSGSVKIHNSQFTIENVNRRVDSLGIIWYNKFSGDTIPVFKPLAEEEVRSEFLANAPPAGLDSTETALNFEELRRSLELKKRENQLEFSLPKAIVRYCEDPFVNEETACVVVLVQHGLTILPKNCAAISFGSDFPHSKLPKKGDTIRVKFSTNEFSDVPFLNAVSGTPRLVRNGTSKHEAIAEGATSKRFIGENLPRTAIGMNKSGTTLYFVSVDGTHYKHGTRGMTLTEIAAIMKKIGAYNAMNLDGGGSAGMVVGGRNVVRNDGCEFNRRIAVGLAVMKKKK